MPLLIFQNPVETAAGGSKAETGKRLGTLGKTAWNWDQAWWGRRWNNCVEIGDGVKERDQAWWDRRLGIGDGTQERD